MYLLPSFGLLYAAKVFFWVASGNCLRVGFGLDNTSRVFPDCCDEKRNYSKP